MSQTARIALFVLLMLMLAACGQADGLPSSGGSTGEDSSQEAVALDLGGMLAPEGTARETYFAPFPVAIELDGDLVDWEGVPRVTIPETADRVQGATTLTFAVAADDEYLYFMGDVTDPKIITGQHGPNYWNEDSVEFYVNATGDLGLSTYRPGVAQITIPPLNAGLSPEETVVGGVQGESAEARVQVIETEKGYALEAAVPLKNQVWDIQREHGNVIGFQAHLNGASDTDRNLKVIWSIFDEGDRSYQNPSLFGQLIFFEIGQSSIVINLPEEAETVGLPPVPADAPYKDPALPVEERVADLLDRMSLAEKIGQMTLVEKNSIIPADITTLGLGGLLSGGGGYPDDENSPAAWADMVDGFQERALEARLGIPLLYGVDAVHGHSNVVGAVIFPHNIGLGAANDPALMEEIGRVTAREMIATGIYWNYAPAVSVPHDIRWGRTYEGYGEDPALVTALAGGYLRGLQGADLAAADTVLATPKHFVGDGGTAWGSSTTNNYQIDQGVTEIDEETLRAIHLLPYPAVIESGAQSIMISYSSWGGMKMHAQRYLIEDVLREELGFEGFIVSDWAGIDQISPDYEEAVVTAINAGIDMNMVPYDYQRFIAVMNDAVESGAISMARIDEAVGSILTVKFSLGLFERPFSDPELLARVGSAEHRAVAREAVARSLVLLKNDGDLLPLSPDLPLLWIGGEAADDIGIQSGGWTIEWQGAEGEITEGTTILEGIERAVSAETAVVYDPFGRFEGDPAGPPAVCLAVVGERPYAEGLGDSADLRLPVADVRLLDRMAESCEQLAVILISGRPLIIADRLAEWDGLVAVWLPGTEGDGVADVLFGEEPFSGRLPYTWPRTVDPLPFNFSSLVESEVLFPRGFGLGAAD